jgi:diguanylate cyclase (GGDEF)-like protein
MLTQPALLDLLQRLIDIGIALGTQRHLPTLLESILTEARRFTRAQAGTLFLREGDRLTFAVCHNDVLAARDGAAELEAKVRDQWVVVDGSSLAGYAALHNEIINVGDAYAASGDGRYPFNRLYDADLAYRTRSVLVTPMQDPGGEVVGVLQLINALDGAGEIVAFHRGWEPLVRSLASQAAVAIQNVRLQELSFKDPLTGIYNRRYFSLRLDEELRRQTRSGRALSLILVDVDDFKTLNDTKGHRAGDEALMELATMLSAQPARGLSITSRYGGDEFAVLIPDTGKAAAVQCARRLRDAIGGHHFAHGRFTISAGVASLPEDATSGEELVIAADQALLKAKRAGGGCVATF